MLHSKQLTVQAKPVFALIAQTYHSMLAQNQTYGLLTWGLASISLCIDWKHEPGSHVNCQLFKSEPGIPYIMLCLVLLQLKTGLVPDHQVAGFAERYINSAGTLHKRDDPEDQDYHSRPSKSKRVHSSLAQHASSNKERQAVLSFFQPLNLKRCRLAEPDNLIMYMIDIVDRQQRGEPITREELDGLLLRPLIHASCLLGSITRLHLLRLLHKRDSATRNWITIAILYSQSQP